MVGFSRLSLVVLFATALAAGCGPSDVATGDPDANGDIADARPHIDAPESDASVTDATIADAPPDAEVDAVPCTPDPDGETCNGIDDDCDGLTDEGFPGVGAECDVGIGACERTGNTICSPDGTTVECDAMPGPPATELCETFVDEDCDGLVDEGFGLLGSACTSGTGACQAAGVYVCTADRLSLSCNATPGTPGTELCGTSIDEDCDGMVDEGFPTIGTSCTTGIGACLRTGVYVCNATGTGTTCNAVPGMASPETCNSVDDDCDGTVDDGNPGGGSSCSTGLAGVCGPGTMTCSGGALGCQQNVMAGTETCNASDDDCDGMVDEGFSLGSACDGTDGDLCNEGVIVCNGAGATTCNDTSGTNSELCNGTDDDCDGTIDEGYVLGAACDGADGDLCNEGTIVCNAAGTGTTCNDATGTNSELCNGTDDDCDAAIDEGYTLGTACDGADGDLCNEGTTVCNAAGTGTTCSDTTGTNSELCNGVDDDCDAAIDEGYTLGAPCDGTDGDLCNEGTIVCNAAGTGTTCSDTSTTNPELCDTVDNDCDGTNNEGFTLGAACDGTDGDLCNEGTIVCNAAGTGTTCSDTTGTTAEICNSIDDDCDGSTDEGFTLGGACDGTDGDLCNEGVTICNAAGTGTTCSDTSATNPELCNGSDDDCDGSIDEGYVLGAACDGTDGNLCNEGNVVCNGAGTGTTCSDTSPTNVESCNSSDDDCDGLTDEGFSVGAACDGADTDLCNEGTLSCNAAGTGTNCSDTSPNNVEICNSTDDDCDGSIDEGFSLSTDVNNCGSCGNVCTNPYGTTSCVGGGCTPVCTGASNCDGNNNNGCELLRDDNPVCGPTTLYNLGSLSGDTGTGTRTDTWSDKEWDQIIITEDYTLPLYISARFELQSPPGVDFDMCVYCASCGGTLVGCSTAGAGALDTVQYHHDDVAGPDDDRTLIVQIYYYSATACGNWSLTVFGNVANTTPNVCP